jgi:glycosyltransferase involved in cell wall biosynthesis
MKHILIDARFRDGSPGGIQQVVIGLAQVLSQLDLAGNRVTFLLLEGHTAWLEPFLPQGASIACVPTSSAATSAGGFLARVKAFVRDRFGHLLGQSSIQIPAEPAIVKELNPDLIHFVHQNCFRTDRPFLFTPHDLQHEYYPEYFTKRTVMVRRYLYKYYAMRAQAVVCISKACQQDVVKYLGVSADKCPVIYNAPVTEGYEAPEDDVLSSVRAKYALPESFFFYPARSYPHKNHIALVRAVAQLRDEGTVVSVVCSGAPTPYFEAPVRPLIQALKLDAQFDFVGFVSTAELNALYALATALVFPSLFEGFGLPLIDAMRAGLPVMCSDNSALPEVVGDAALKFNAQDVAEMAEHLRHLWEDSDLREALIANGQERAKLFNWQRSAKQYLELYQRVLAIAKK